MAKTTADRMMANIVIGGPNECWPWTGYASGVGYGNLTVAGVTTYAHRWIYEHLVGPIPEGLQVDHLCHNADLACAGGLSCPHRKCCNPRHLEPVTQLENIQRAAARITHCPRGHDYAEHGRLVWGKPRKDGTQVRVKACGACHREQERGAKARRRAARNGPSVAP